MALPLVAFSLERARDLRAGRIVRPTRAAGPRCQPRPALGGRPRSPVRARRGRHDRSHRRARAGAPAEPSLRPSQQRCPPDCGPLTVPRYRRDHAGSPRAEPRARRWRAPARRPAPAAGAGAGLRHQLLGSREPKPTLRTVWMKRGLAGSSPSLRRSSPMWTSRVFVDPNQFSSQTSAIRSSRHGATGSARERREQVELLPGQLHLLAVEPHPARVEVDVELTERDRASVEPRRRVGRGGAQRGSLRSPRRR